MLNILRNLFNKNKGYNIALPAKQELNKKPLETYYREEIELSEFVKKEAVETLIRHYKHEINIIKTTNKLSAKEKNALGINARLSILKELISILTSKGIKQNNPKEIISGIYYRAKFSRSRDETILGFIKLGIEYYTLNSACDERECFWCKEQNKKEISISVNANELIKNNCTCNSHCRCHIAPVMFPK